MTHPAQVDLTPSSVRVVLRWFGVLLEGAPLHAVRVAESRWCVEGSELRLTLAKACEGQWWKSLLHGGEERSYHQLLHDAVHAGEGQTHGRARHRSACHECPCRLSSRQGAELHRGRRSRCMHLVVVCPLQPAPSHAAPVYLVKS